MQITDKANISKSVGQIIRLFLHNIAHSTNRNTEYILMSNVNTLDIATLLWRKKTFIKTVIGDVVAHLKPQKFTVFVRFVMYCFITSASDIFYWAPSDDTRDERCFIWK